MVDSFLHIFELGFQGPALLCHDPDVLRIVVSHPPANQSLSNPFLEQSYRFFPEEDFNYITLCLVSLRQRRGCQTEVPRIDLMLGVAALVD